MPVCLANNHKGLLPPCITGIHSKPMITITTVATRPTQTNCAWVASV